MVAVLKAVSDAESVQPTDLPSPHFSVDPDALDALFERTLSRSDGAGVRVEFSNTSREVTVESDGSVVVTPRQEVD